MMTGCFLRLLIATVLVFVTIPALAADPEGIRFFESKIRPLLVQECQQCHSQKGKKIEAGFSLDSRQQVIQGGDRGPAINLEKPSESLLIQAVTYQDDDLQMPPKKQLGKDQVALLKKWIQLGAPMPVTAPAPSTTAGIDLAAGRKHWAFQPLRPQGPPATSSWSRQGMDDWIQINRQQEGIESVDEAGRQVLIRRLSYDLRGLPPSWDEVTEFIEDPSVDAYEKVVDRYLASPQYGERWARYWLDLARYTDTTASWLKGTGKAYHYRDWIVRAFNEDIPYDRFVLLQLAADHLAEIRSDDIAALGFLGLSPTYWKELRLAPDMIKTIVAEEWEERIDTIGRTFLGLSLACARCHDHKFDPVSIEDYYALAGVLASTQLVDEPLLREPLAEVVRQADRKIIEIENAIHKQKTLAEDGQDATVSQQRIKDLQQQIKNIKKNTMHFDAPRVHSVKDASIHVLPDEPDRTRIVYHDNQPINLAVQLRGEPGRPGKIVPRRFIEVLSAGKPSPFQKGSGRLELGQAIVTDAKALTARVMVNRIWRHHFGTGLVATPSDFGNQGSKPSHPELLDQLAREFVAHDWSVKWLHRYIILSSTYRQSSHFVQSSQQQDPENRFYWRMNRRRLDIEAWRDAMLLCSQSLDYRIGGSAQELGDAKNQRRTIYGTVKRRDLDTMLRLHGFPEPTGHSPQRAVTTDPLQQLFALNSDFIWQRANELSRQFQESDQDLIRSIELLYQRLFSRLPDLEEVALGKQFLQKVSATEIAPRRWQRYVHTLLISNEFSHLD
jgi:hypothetical protein